ncbi:peptide chain release factor N(5)-glutamine methyltransferase [Bifidobacterium breve]|uniref:peptide chain release factor N(5)-glutamine methyltransferase n=1 Tax=Bifidobacterium breve TaxID=1685 RepID=UPI00080B696B|nr:peptide chain release factor N(5)-glutamine methyltransferase [Bifidobacterium breve]AUE05826.1 Peptide release factor-glutamine N5-methyltransferase [Bifidobacterium breve]AUE21249.1 Peptide release factor-glutamine N5-methyltransferase [Bifidobacterium breve]
MAAADVIRDAAVQLREAGIETPEHDAKLLLAEAAGVELRDVDKALLMGEELGTAEQLARFQSMLARRAKREPLQYITGHAPFRYLDLKVGLGVFIPRPETETVVQAGLDWLTEHGMIHPRVVDLCAGSGAIGLSVVSEVPGSQVWAVELSPNTAEWTNKNLAETAKRYPSIASNYQLEIADATSLATLAQLDGTIDIVITNPPYVPESDVPEQPEVRVWDPELALYGGSMDGTLIPERIIERAYRLLKPGGALVMEHDVTQGDRLVAYAKAAGFTTASTGRDWTGRDRYLFAVA